MMLTDNNNGSAIYNLEENMNDKKTSDVCANRPSSPRKFFERLYGHLEKESPNPRYAANLETESQLIDPIRSPSVSSDSTSRSSPTLDIEETDGPGTLYSDSVRLSDSYDRRSYSGYTTTLPVGQTSTSFGQQGLPIGPLVAGYGSTFRPFFGLGPDGSHMPAGLSAFCKYFGESNNICTKLA